MNWEKYRKDLKACPLRTPRIKKAKLLDLRVSLSPHGVVLNKSNYFDFRMPDVYYAEVIQTFFVEPQT